MRDQQIDDLEGQLRKYSRELPSVGEQLKELERKLSRSKGVATRKDEEVTCVFWSGRHGYR